LAGEGAFGGKPVAFHDPFRVKNGAIAEPWEIIETIPRQGRLEEPERQILNP
jgi:predicted SnoaL-like aldol condensation-catalyzing enzyme